MSTLGFSYEAPAGTGDFIPIIKYDAKAGRFFRVDRVEGINGWESQPVDITDEFKALADLENVEVGPINFNTGGAPSFLLARRDEVADPKNPVGLPQAPDSNHKPGVRVMLKLSAACGGDKRVRELAQNSRAFLGAIDKVIQLYLAEKDQHPGMLPVIALDGKPVGVKSGSGTRSSTNYHPKFKIVQWAPRGDLVYVPKTLKARAQSTSVNGNRTAQQQATNTKTSPPDDDFDTAPSTGAQRAEPPKQTNLADDFG